MWNTWDQRLLSGMMIALSCVIGVNLTACNTTKATVDTTVQFFSSTSPHSLFTADGMVEPKQKINLFAGVAYENLRQEVAAGQGEHVTSLAMLYGVPMAKHDDFRRILQHRYAELFTTDLQRDPRAHLHLVSALNRMLNEERLLIQ